MAGERAGEVEVRLPFFGGFRARERACIRGKEAGKKWEKTKFSVHLGPLKEQRGANSSSRRLLSLRPILSSSSGFSFSDWL